MSVSYPDLDAIETIQRITLRTIARNPAGEGLWLIGGLRFRIVDGSQRRSIDIDFHCTGDLGHRQMELVPLLRRKLLPEVEARLGYDGSVSVARGPNAESVSVKTVDLFFWKEGVPHSRIEIPVDLTRIPCLDRPAVRTIEGVVCLVASDADMVESKILSLFNRLVVAPRDLVDLFFFSHMLLPDTPDRLREKLTMLKLHEQGVRTRFCTIMDSRASHVRAIAEVLATQVDAQAAANIEQAGGAQLVFDRVARTIEKHLPFVVKDQP
jgi:hypothetical protein